jgi:flagellar motor switch/type III secretory pathway protein FliN
MSSSQTSSSSSDAIGATPLAPLFDVACAVDFIIGTSRVSVGDCLRLGLESVVRLDQPAGSDFDVRVHGVSIAAGEVSVVDDDAAVRITRIAAPAGVGWE